jgi:hypothetical protein
VPNLLKVRILIFAKKRGVGDYSQIHPKFQTNIFVNYVPILVLLYGELLSPFCFVIAGVMLTFT